MKSDDFQRIYILLFDIYRYQILIYTVFLHLIAIANSVNLAYSLDLLNWQVYILDSRHWYPADEAGDPV
jgi:hypothetical protein